MGVHRVQRVPAGQGRRHTSTVTVALVEGRSGPQGLSLDDVEIETYRGGGPGGQHRNTSDTGVRARHVPTGIVAKVDRGRSWWRNRADALAELERRVQVDQQASATAGQNDARVAQVGAGDRPSHDWTWCAWRDEVVAHGSGRHWPMKAALRGRFLG